MPLKKWICNSNRKNYADSYRIPYTMRRNMFFQFLISCMERFAVLSARYWIVFSISIRRYWSGTSFGLLIYSKASYQLFQYPIAVNNANLARADRDIGSTMLK